MRNVYINKVAVFLPNKPVSIVDHFWQQENFSCCRFSL